MGQAPGGREQQPNRSLWNDTPSVKMNIHVLMPYALGKCQILRRTGLQCIARDRYIPNLQLYNHLQENKPPYYFVK